MFSHDLSRIDPFAKLSANVCYFSEADCRSRRIAFSNGLRTGEAKSSIEAAAQGSGRAVGGATGIGGAGVGGAEGAVDDASAR
jgi:hypothetical protein